MTQQAELFASPSIPNHWIAYASDETWYLFPAINNGWAQRRPYLGHHVGLTPVDMANIPASLDRVGGWFEFATMMSTPWILPCPK